MAKKYVYFVAYAATFNGLTGLTTRLGSHQHSGDKIEDMTQIHAIAEKIRKELPFLIGVEITNFILLREEEVAED